MLSVRRVSLLCTLAWAVACGGEREGLHLDMAHDFDGVERTFHFFEASGHRDQPKPLVILLHGGGGLIDNHIGVGARTWPHERWLDLAAVEGLHVAVPQGVGRHWNDCRADCAHCGDEDDAGFVLDLIDTLSARYGVDGDRVYAVGESNGGFMTQRLAQEHPDRFAGMGVVIAQMPAHNECDVDPAPIPMMFQVGTADMAVPYDGGTSPSPGSGTMLSVQESVDHWAAVNGCAEGTTTVPVPDGEVGDGSTAAFEIWDCAATGAGLEVVHLEGAGHVPPSVRYPVSELWQGLVGRQNQDIESADVFWAFLRDHDRE